jgi:ariadne-1
MSDPEYSDEDYFDDDEDMLDAEDGKHMSLLRCMWGPILITRPGSAPSDEDIDIDFNDDIHTSLKAKKKTYEVEYDSFSQQEVEKRMKSDIDGISSIFGVDVSDPYLDRSPMNDVQCLCLTQHFAWTLCRR